MRKNVFVSLFVIFIAFFSFNLNSQSVVNSTNDTLAFSGIHKFYFSGITESDFHATEAIQWLPVGSDTMRWESPDIELKNQLVYADFVKKLLQLASSSVVDVFVSSMKSEDDRPIYCMEIGRGKEFIVFTGGVHAREIANPQFLLKFSADLASAWEKGDTTVCELLNQVKIVILPCVNPDGYDAAIRGRVAIKNKDLYLAKCANSEVLKAKCNARGVDLNRNFPSYSASALWRGKVENTKLMYYKPAIYFYPGKYLGSEKETKVAMNFLLRYIPSAVRFVDFHSAGRVIFAGKPHLSDSFNAACASTGSLIGGVSGYKLLGLDEEESGNGTDGTMTDFASEITAGFVYNPILGRLAPPDTIQLIPKTDKYKYACSVNTVETLRTLNSHKPAKQQLSTPQMHIQEWNKFRLKELFLALVKLPKI